MVQDETREKETFGEKEETEEMKSEDPEEEENQQSMRSLELNSLCPIIPLNWVDFRVLLGGGMLGLNSPDMKVCFQQILHIPFGKGSRLPNIDC